MEFLQHPYPGKIPALHKLHERPDEFLPRALPYREETPQRQPSILRNRILDNPASGTGSILVTGPDGAMNGSQQILLHREKGLVQEIAEPRVLPYAGVDVCCVRVDAAHEGYLVVLLRQTVLIDAYCVDPEISVF